MSSEQAEAEGSAATPPPGNLLSAQGVRGINTQELGLRGFSISSEILEETMSFPEGLGISPGKLHARPNTSLSPNRCLLIGPLVISLSRLVHTSSV